MARKIDLDVFIEIVTHNRGISFIQPFQEVDLTEKVGEGWKLVVKKELSHNEKKRYDPFNFESSTVKDKDNTSVCTIQRDIGYHNGRRKIEYITYNIPPKN